MYFSDSLLQVGPLIAACILFSIGSLCSGGDVCRSMGGRGDISPYSLKWRGRCVLISHP